MTSANEAQHILAEISTAHEEASRTHFLWNIEQMQGNAALMRYNKEGRLEAVYVSEEFARMMECSRDEALVLMNHGNFLKTTHPEDRPFVRSMLKRRVGDDGSSSLTIQKLTAKRNPIWCNVHYAFIDDFNEHYVYCTYSNVTKLKQYEERLRGIYISLGNNFFQTGERTLMLARINLSRDIIEESKGKDLLEVEQANYPYSEALQTRSGMLPVKEERAHFLRVFDRKNLINSYLEGKVTISDLYFAHRGNGSYCVVQTTATMTRHPLTGDVVAFLTEEEANTKKVERTLMSTILAQQFDMVAYLTNGEYGVTIGDASRIREGNIFPTARHGVYQSYLENQVRPVLYGEGDYTERMMEALSLDAVRKNTTGGGTPYIVDIAIRIDGEDYHKRFDFYAVDPEADFYIVLKSDTTKLNREQARRNEQLKQALAEAEQANLAKTSFLSSMSHEIRTPMNAIIGIDNIALQDPTLSEKTREYFEKIGSSARHLLSLINDILDMSRIESGRMVLKNEEFSFRDFLTQINTMVSSQCLEKGLTYDCRIGQELSDFYIGDDMKLKQVIINILGNAVKFTDPGGTVTFLVEQVTKFSDQATMRFTMKDTGIGMDEEYVPKIFEAFSQEDATATNRYGGSGLGMAITKNMVEMMNGSIEVSSKKGVGSVFTVTVTLRVSERILDHEPSRIRPQDMNVLIIDDDPIDCEHAKAVLDEVGIVSDIAMTGEEAIEMVRLRNARQHPYDLILMDLRMPEQDGIEVTRRIRKLHGNSSTIVILTAYTWADVEEQAVEAGVDSFMSKPLFADDVVAEFQQAIAKKELIRSGTEKKPADLNGRRILLAEDIAINAEIMMMVLQMNGMQAEHAENGQLALDMFTSHPKGYYDAVLMDMRMPVMDGLTAAKEMRAADHPDAKEIPIIALTANAFDEDVQRSLQAGMNAHLSKPVEPEDLITTLAGLIRN